MVMITAISVGVFAGVFTIAIMLGWVNQRIEAVINTEISHIQIHHPDYLETNEVHDYIPDIVSMQQQIEQRAGVKAVSSRVIATCMVASAETGSGVQLVGIDPENERLVTNIHEKIIDGEYFDGVKSNPIVIGEKLANKLKVKVRSKIVITVTEMDGTLTGAAFRVAGIYKTSNTAYDEMKAFVKADDLRNLLKLDEKAGHQIAIVVNSNGTEKNESDELKKALPYYKILTWTQILPEMELMNENMNLMMYIFVVIILLALGFGIVNTMLMVILERIKELGMLMAVGMNKIRVFLMIVLETIFLSLTGGVIGIVIALTLTAAMQKTGIDLSLWAEGLNSLGYDAIIYPQISLNEVIVVTILVIITGVFSAIVPARKAIRLNPSEAIRIDM